MGSLFRLLKYLGRLLTLTPQVPGIRLVPWSSLVSQRPNSTHQGRGRGPWTTGNIRPFLHSLLPLHSLSRTAPFRIRSYSSETKKRKALLTYLDSGKSALTDFQDHAGAHSELLIGIQQFFTVNSYRAVARSTCALHCYCLQDPPLPGA